MEPVFGAAAWPPQERTRRGYAVAPEARYVFASAVADGAGDTAAPDAPQPPPPPPLGFLQYRFDLEEQVPVLYVYELQVTGAHAAQQLAGFPPRAARRLTRAPRAAAARGRGLGKFLMLFAEMLARRSPGPLAGVMLTIQKANARALHFYTAKCKYVEDDISPAKAR
jgi:hypothetical protein